MWDERYAADEYAYGKNANDFLTARHGVLPKGKILCLADGEGRNSVFLARQGYEVTAVDLSLAGLEKGKKLALEYGVEVNFVHADLAGFDVGDNCWDGVVSIFCHLPPVIRSALHGKVVNGLKKGGVFLAEAYTPQQLNYGTGGPPDAAMMMSCALLAEELRELDFTLLQEIEREVVEGRFHTGLAAVVQAIAVKR